MQVTQLARLYISVRRQSKVDMILDMLFDYLLGDMPEYKKRLDNAGLDTNPDNWIRYTTCYGNFIHFIHIPTGGKL